MLRRLQIAALIGLVFVFVYACRFWRSESFASIVGVGIVSAGAFLLAGFLTGFVFGIPRVSKDSGGQASSEQPKSGGTPPEGSLRRSTKPGFGSVEANSNLVEISDWLTKIIVGVGLVQMNRIPNKIQGLTAYLGNGLRDCDQTLCKQSSEAFALGIIIFYFCSGFLIGYLWSRLYLQKAFVDLNLANQIDTAWDFADAADQAFDDGDFDKANELTDLALSNDPLNAKAHLLKGMILKRRAQAAGKPGDKALLQQALNNAVEAVRLRPNVAGAYYNTACYQTLLGVDGAEVLKNLSRAFELDPKLKRTAATDEDLRSLWDNADFKRLIA
jgi:hypothetical protein